MKHVVYVGADDHLHELVWTPGATLPTHTDLTAKSSGPAAKGKVSAFTLKSTRTAHVIFTGKNDQVYEIVRGDGLPKSVFWRAVILEILASGALETARLLRDGLKSAFGNSHVGAWADGLRTRA